MMTKQDGTRKPWRRFLWEAMLNGVELVDFTESIDKYLSIDSSGRLCGCALGALAAQADVGWDSPRPERDLLWNATDMGVEIYGERWFTERLHIDPLIAAEINRRHIGGSPIRAIAAWLKTEHPTAEMWV